MESRNEQLIKELTEKVENLEKTNDQIRKDKLDDERNFLEVKETMRHEIEQLKQLYENAQNYNRLISRIKPKASDTSRSKKASAKNSSASDEEDLKNMNKLIDMLDDNDDVQNVYHNWDE